VKHVVGIADMALSSSMGDEIITYALGSCVGVVLYDPIARIGGLVHAMLPSSSADPERAANNPYMFVDTGIKELFLASYKAGAQKGRMQVVAAGGACTAGSEQDNYLQIGKRNVTLLKSIFWKNGVLMKNSDFGGTAARTLSLQIGTGVVAVKINGVTQILAGNPGGAK
jgi:chemotaxis protein CheD